MACRGVLFAIDEAATRALRRASSDDEVLEVVEAIEERWDQRYLAETDKAWDV